MLLSGLYHKEKYNTKKFRNNLDKTMYIPSLKLSEKVILIFNNT